eukprot:7382933-Prymnesium_polylepis.2
MRRPEPPAAQRHRPRLWPESAQRQVCLLLAMRAPPPATARRVETERPLHRAHAALPRLPPAVHPRPWAARSIGVRSPAGTRPHTARWAPAAPRARHEPRPTEPGQKQAQVDGGRRA